ncbi:helix-turn-helix domain-containing protein [Cellulomonas edaphi]|uniref:HTH cro/C1-type domain-containing protein n=1 Tax=Cellulomonas edaphi TaxID=3053468 RepID=A0ABT7S6I1_9CELL|nr:helix-turn-helix domain-containing protein [Cellulomons edaphi]MDM7831215.1 hypothetical protein [Cellulomons edaphi]
MPYALTIDQRGSRIHGDRVEDFLARLAALLERADPTGAAVVRPFERTVGDEVQAVLDDPRVVVDLALSVARDGGWSVGIGAGPVDEPLPESARAGSGAAFILARTAVEAAKSRSRSVALAVRAVDDGAGRDAEAVLVLAAATAARRSEQGWQVVDAMAEAGLRQEDVAERLGISQQAVSKRLRTALWAEEIAARSAAVRLLALAAGERPA